MSASIESIKKEIEEIRRPSGTQTNPARSCKDLYLCNKGKKDGQFIGLKLKFFFFQNRNVKSLCVLLIQKAMFVSFNFFLCVQVTSGSIPTKAVPMMQSVCSATLPPRDRRVFIPTKKLARYRSQNKDYQPEVRLSVGVFEVDVLAHVASRILSSPSIRHPGKFPRQFLPPAFFVYRTL